MATDKTTIKMKFMGTFKGPQKVVQLPIPLISNSQKLDKTLVFERANDSHGPAFCEVPIEWAGALLDLGGNWQTVGTITADLRNQITTAQSMCNAKMKTFADENVMVDA